MMTGQQYLDSLRDGRRVYLDGERCDDVTTHEGLGQSARIVARGYDALVLSGSGGAQPGVHHPEDRGGSA